jgi:hypothetical protein
VQWVVSSGRRQLQRFAREVVADIRTDDPEPRVPLF